MSVDVAGPAGGDDVLGREPPAFTPPLQVFRCTGIPFAASCGGHWCVAVEAEPDLSPERGGAEMMQFGRHELIPDLGVAQLTSPP